MVTNKNNLFRKQALERSSSPERLDQIMQVVSPMSWLPLLALGSLVAAGLAWSILGRIPITVEGRGVLVYPSKVVPLQFPAIEGKLKVVNVHVGDFVKKGQVLATIDQDELNKQLQQQQAKLAELSSQDLNAISLQGQRSQLEVKAIAQQRLGLQQRLLEAQSLTPIIRDKDIGALAEQRRNLQQRLQEAQSLAPTFQDRLNRRKALRAEGAISSDQVLEAQQTYLDSIAKVANFSTQLKQLDVSQVQAEKSYRENLSQITDLKTQLKQLDTKETTLNEQNFQASINRTNQIQDLKRGIAELQRKLTGNSEIKSDRTGRILELTVSSGQIIGAGSRIGAIETQEPSAKLLAVTFLPVSEGKKVQKGMKLQITPSTVKREEFGGIAGKITNVSPFPVTKEAAASLVGNPEIVGSLVGSEPQIQVLSELQPNKSTYSGYQWSSSKGPQLKMSPGTTTSVRVTIEEQAPITFVLPILKSWSGIY
ncbi:NHLP bacteriocin system secretion protein [Calothrix sp. PCC 7507]|uniref:NHLP bacteriocin system secretion protein n=1 Tax=Calothrix sp. PCC 7507 TaxID=99598 RepID=UPI00029F4641|nr:NHLP bacteriocin system secretion protein [Calothrix sp. PCC 7507]AFY34445.1 NHPM bacteriocin system secretion protein [Calothrix sp. PCC 7507]